MCKTTAISLQGVGKMYKLFASRFDNLIDALGFNRVYGRQANKHREFWALRDIDLELQRGRRIGIVGRNGAGKSTLLKLITGNIAPTEGTIRVNGRVQALMSTGAGFHPEFTGYDNVRASLTYLGMTGSQIEAAVSDIEEFTELGAFLRQPFKTYSAGMQARLTFATATAITPDILIIDEILGAGDAYFISKSMERMAGLMDSGAAVLLVSHALDHITRMCDQAIWIDRGRVVLQGESMEVVKQYDVFMRKLDDRRIRAKNVKKQQGGTYSREQLENNADTVQINLAVSGSERAICEVRRVNLLQNSTVLGRVDVGAPQDASPLEDGFIALDGTNWSEPIEYDGGYLRRIVAGRGDGAGIGTVWFSMPVIDESRENAVEIEYRCQDPASAQVSITVLKNGVVRGTGACAPQNGDWCRARIVMNGAESVHGCEPIDGRVSPKVAGRNHSHWPGEGSLRITTLTLKNDLNEEQAVYERGSAMRLTVQFDAVTPGSFKVLPVAVIYRIDGINVSTHLGEWIELTLTQGNSRQATLSIPHLNLGNGNYTISVALYKEFDEHLHTPPVVYDWIDRSLEFRVVGTPLAISSVFILPSEWSIR